MVTEEDFKTHLYEEIIDTIDRDDPDMLNDAIAAAEAEAIGYLSRYDTDTLFAAVDDDRDKSLVMIIKDIAVWHFIVVANPNTDMAMRRTRYEDAKSILKDIQSGKIVKKNWPLPEVEAESQFFHVNSAPKRPTRW